MRPFTVLNDAQVQSFLDKGYLIVEDCLDLHIAKRWIDQAYERLAKSDVKYRFVIDIASLR